MVTLALWTGTRSARYRAQVKPRPDGPHPPAENAENWRSTFFFA